MSEELKTLKDIKPYMAGTTLVEFDYMKEKVRQEAIKWIKELKKRDGEENSPSYLDKPFGNFCDSGYDEYALHPFGNVIEWIKHFFNIKEEELE